MIDRWPAFIFSILLATAFLNGLLVYFAMQDPSEAVEQNPYEHGLNYETTIAALRLPQELGWKVAFELKPAMSEQQLLLSLQNQSGEPLTDARIRLSALRPNNQAQDFSSVMAEQAPGQYSLPVRLRTGAWWLRFFIQTDDHTAEVRRSITVQ